MTFKSVLFSVCYGLIKRSQDFGESLNNAVLTQTYHTNNIYHLFHAQSLYYSMVLSFKFSFLLSRLFEDPKIQSKLQVSPVIKKISTGGYWRSGIPWYRVITVAKNF